MGRDKNLAGHGHDAGRLRQLIESIPLAVRLFLDERVSAAAKAIPLVGVIYLVWPIDLLPDLFPALGQLDDIAVIMLALNWFIRVCPTDIVEEIRHGGQASRQSEDDDTISARYTVVDEGDASRS